MLVKVTAHVHYVKDVKFRTKQVFVGIIHSLTYKKKTGWIFHISYFERSLVGYTSR